MGLTIIIPGASFTNGIPPLNPLVSTYRTTQLTYSQTISDTKYSALNTFITTLTTEGILAKLAEIYTFNGSNLSGALIKLKGVGSSTLAVSGTPSPIWSTSGLTIDGNEGILNTGATMPSTSAISWYCGTNTLASLTIPVSGSATHEISVNLSGQVQGAVGNGGGGNPVVHTDANMIGLWTVSRDNATSLKLYKGASLVAENTTSTTLVPSAAIQLGNRDGLVLAEIPHLTRFVALWNSSASALDISKLNTALNIYLSVSSS
jgi:hypothetical protein